jgi:hypothetical protein
MLRLAPGELHVSRYKVGYLESSSSSPLGNREEGVENARV